MRPDRKYTAFKYISKQFADGKGGKVFAWLILRKDKKLLRNLYYSLSRNDQRGGFLLLKTLLEDVAVAFGFLFNWDSKRRYKPDMKKSLALLNKEIPLPLDYEFENFHQLYGHFNQFSHFNFRTFQSQVARFVQRKPEVNDKTSIELQYLFCLDVYMHLQQCYFPFKEIFSMEKRSELKYVFKDSTGALAGFSIPVKIQRHIHRWISIYTFLSRHNLLPVNYPGRNIEQNLDPSP